MQQCPRCGQHFRYWKMVFAVITTTCSLCGSRYRVLSRRHPLQLACVLIAIVVTVVLQKLLPDRIDWIAVIIVLPILLAIAPLNQRIDRLDK